MLTLVWQSLVLVGVLVGLVWGLTAAASGLLKNKDRLRIRKRATAAWTMLEQAGPFAVVKAPLEIFSAALDAAYTAKIMSWRGFIRSSLINTVLCFAALLILGVVSGKPLGIETAPWAVFDETLQAIERTEHNPATFQNAYPEQVAQLKSWFATVLSFKTPFYKWSYIFGFVGFVVLLSWILEFVCLAAARTLVREMIQIRTPLALIALHTFNLFFVAVTICAALCLAVVAGAPITWPFVLILYKLSLASVWVAVVLGPIGIFLLVIFSPVWIRVVVAVAALPSVVLLAVTLIALLLAPFRGKIHRVVSDLLSRIRLNEKAVIAACLTIFFVGLVVLSAVLTYLPSAIRPVFNNPLSGMPSRP